MARWQSRIRKPQQTSEKGKVKPQLAPTVQAKLNLAQLETDENAPLTTERSALEQSGSLLERASINTPESPSSRPTPLAQSPLQRWSLQRDGKGASAVQRDEVDLLPKDSGKPIHPKVGEAFTNAGHPEVAAQAKVHDGPEADAAAKSIGSNAYTISDPHSSTKHIVMQSKLGNDIPTQTHEGTHVSHQHHKNIQPTIGGTPINDDAGMEGNARANEQRIMKGESLEVDLS